MGNAGIWRENMEQEDLNLHLETRLTHLENAKTKGIKIVGYFPGNYVPEEIIYASGAVPVCLASVSSRHANAALNEMPDIICPFARAQIGQRLLKTDEYYSMIDMLIAPITCIHIKETAEWCEHHGGVEIFKLGVPHQYSTDFGLEYYIDRLKVLKHRLEDLTGNAIADKHLSEAIDLYNRIRKFLRNIALLRTASHPPISALDFVKLNHASFYADPAFYADTLNLIHRRLEMTQQSEHIDLPRLLLMGPNISYGDYSIMELVESAGGSIVAEEIFEGVRCYSQDIENKGDLIRSLAIGYLRNRVPPALMRNSAGTRFKYVMELIKEYVINGVIWYQLANCEVYDAESYFFSKRMNEFHIPFIVLESDYDTAGLRQMRLRVEALIEQIRGV
jgi:benzoyl-CoA reductase/2-hydroxyglutaryl-CoA dehydratase subunit BcrC/BadD/HgdB